MPWPVRQPRPAAWPRSHAASMDLPIPAAPATNTVRPRPRPASSSSRSNVDNWSPRPTIAGRLLGRRRPGQAIEERVPQRDRLLTGADAKLAMHGPLHPLELAQRRPAIPPRRVFAHQREVGLGIGRVGLEQVRPAPGLP